MSFRLAQHARRITSLEYHHHRCKYTFSTAVIPQTTSKFTPRQSPPTLYATPPSTYQNPRLKPQTRLGQLRVDLTRCAQSESGNVIRAFEICREMKEMGVQPDIISYKQLIYACSKQYLGEETISLLEDMPNLGLAPDLETFNIVLSAQLFNENFSVDGLLDAMQRVKIAPNMDSYYYMIRHYAHSNNLEMCMQSFADMTSRGITFNLKTIQTIIDLAARLEHARLALEVAYAFESTSPRSLQASDWMNILSASTATHFEEGTLAAWEQLKQFQITPDEGQCIEVLNTAGRHGLVEAAADALQALRRMQVPYQEYHFAPLLEAYCHHKMFREAFEVIDVMRSLRIEFTQETLEPLVQCLGSDIDRIDEAWSLLEKVHENGKAIDIHSINVILLATVHARDLQRSIGIYKAISSLGSKPTIETFNILLTGCIYFKHRDLGEKVLSDMRELGLAPNVRTFERIIILCLTDKTYEEAFFYLEEMKGLGFKPPRNVYVAIIRKCINSADTRWKVAYDEMEECGYRMDPDLQKFIDLNKHRSNETSADVGSPTMSELEAEEWVEVASKSTNIITGHGTERQDVVNSFEVHVQR